MWNAIIGGSLGLIVLFGVLWLADRITGGDGRWWT